MENLVQEILSISKMKTSAFTLNLECINLSDLLKTCVQENKIFQFKVILKL